MKNLYAHSPFSTVWSETNLKPVAIEKKSVYNTIGIAKAYGRYDLQSEKAPEIHKQNPDKHGGGSEPG